MKPKLEKNLNDGTVLMGDIKRWTNWNKANSESKYEPEDLVDMFLTDKMDSGCKQSYVNGIIKPAVKAYSAFCKALKLKHWDSVSVGEFIRFLLLEKSYATKTVKDKFEKPIDQMFRWLCQGGYIDNYLNKSAYPRLIGLAKKREPITIETVKQIISNAQKIPNIEKRASLLFFVYTAWNTGFRPSDVANLKWSDIDFDEGKISIIPIKTSRTKKLHHVYISDEFKAFLKMFKKQNPPIENNNCDPYRITEISAYKTRMDFLLKKTSPVPVCCTDFRRAVASRAQEIFGDIEKVKSTVGWTSSISARRYITESDDTKKQNWESINQDLGLDINNDQ